jgi:hypothetical protein
MLLLSHKIFQTGFSLFSFCLIKKKKKSRQTQSLRAFYQAFPRLFGYLSIGLQIQKLVDKRSIKKTKQPY